MKLLAALVLGTTSLTAGATAAEGPAPAVPLDPTWRVAFNDDFDALSLRSGGPDEIGLTFGDGRWTVRWPWSRDPRGSRPMTSDYTWYPDPAFAFGGDYPKLGQFSIKDSILSIQAERAPPALAGQDLGANPDAIKIHPGGQYPWVSGTLTTYDSFTVSGPAYFEARIKPPKGRSAWSAFWAYDRDWRSSKAAEIDVLEMINTATSKPHINVVFNQVKYGVFRETHQDLSLDFHLYGAMRTNERVIFYLDGKEIGRSPKFPKAFADESLFLILGLSSGTDLPTWASPPDKTTPSPMTMQVDYVRVWAPTTPSPEGKAARNRDDYATTPAYLQAQAEGGDAYAARYLAAAYEAGNGIPADLTAAAKWYRLAAEAGHPEAQIALAYMYADGRGVAKDHAEATKWFRANAEMAGWAEAEFKLGTAYLYGRGVPVDAKEAVKWLRKAAKQGDSLAMSLLPVAEKQLKGGK